MLSLSELKEKTHFQPWPVEHDGQAPLELLSTFTLNAPPEDVWFYLADTSRFNRALDFAKRTMREEKGQLHVTTTMVGFRQEWIEEPWTWIAGRSVSTNRVYKKGCARYFRALFHVEPSARTGHTDVYVYFGWFPRNRLWREFLKFTHPIVEKKFKDVLDRVVEHLKATEDESKRRAALVKPNAGLEPESQQKLRKIRDELVEKNLKSEVVDRLVKHIETGDDFELNRLRILPLAKAWNVNKRDLLVTCLHATRLGLFNLSWDVICPHCRGTRYSARSLGDLPGEFDCEVCRVDFKTDRLDSVEVTFHVHPSIRQFEKIEYCAAEATKKEHIRIQQLVEPGKEILVQARLREGRHRVRQVGSAHALAVQVTEAPNQTIAWDGLVTPIAVAETGPNPSFTFKNPGLKPAIFVVEELWWENQALRPVELFTLQEFRDLFSEEHLSADVKLSLGQQTILFTDIVGSTKFYQTEGDARAFKEVRDHFVEVFHEVKRHNGAVVKTIGDSVMGAFHTPEDALAAAIEIQLRFNEHRTDTHIRLRISVHTGPVIAVHLHQGIDYFGGTVNMAAKLQACADACEVALSEDVFRICSISYERVLGFALTKRQAPTLQKDGTPLEAFVIKIDRRKGADRRKSA
ncbi:MAG TPA: DUF5939 domain-containing protein [Bdellovibrionales bacterium]|nr:DUF5939 domain-containing protein [Bdellovibrionales bacterium]